MWASVCIGVWVTMIRLYEGSNGEGGDNCLAQPQTGSQRQQQQQRLRQSCIVAAALHAEVMRLIPGISCDFVQILG